MFKSLVDRPVWITVGPKGDEHRLRYDAVEAVEVRHVDGDEYTVSIIVGGLVTTVVQAKGAELDGMLKMFGGVR